MNEKETKQVKKEYVSPKIEHLGKLGTLIQGTSGCSRDFPPNESAPTKEPKC